MLLVLALLVGSGAAFAVTERLKLEPSPIAGTKVDKVFSPVCRCKTNTAKISFRLRRADRVTVDMINGDGDVVSEVVRDRQESRGRVTFYWKGRDSSGAVVPEGSYRPRVHLAPDRRTIVLPNPIRVDTTPPRVQLLSLRPRVFSPDGDRRRDSVTARYRIDEPASVLLYVDGIRRVRVRGLHTHGTVVWFGKVDTRALPEGVYRLSLGALDAAGNLGPQTAGHDVLLRYVAIGRKRIETVAGGRFAVLVLSDAAVIDWRLGARSGTARPGTLRLRAPLTPSRYTLTVTANGHSDRAAVIVRKSP